MSVRRSALGKPVDMNALIAKNENVRAVGNMNVNARGDTIDSHGRVINDKNSRISKMYSKTVQPKTQRPKAPAPQPVVQPPVQEMTMEEKEFEDQDEDFVKEEPKKGKK